MSIASPEIRKKAIEAYQAGKGTFQQIADILGFHATTIARWVQEFREKGKVAPSPRGHMPCAFSEEEDRRIIAMLEEKPDMTLEEIRKALSKKCSLVAVHRTLKRLGYRYKKKR